MSKDYLLTVIFYILCIPSSSYHINSRSFLSFTNEYSPIYSPVPQNKYYSVRSNIKYFDTVNETSTETINHPQINVNFQPLTNDIDDVLYDLFLSQLQDENSLSKQHDERIFLPVSNRKFTKNRIIAAKELVESSTVLKSGDPIEFQYKNQLEIGNYLYSNSKNSIQVQLTSGETVSIDISQIISVWDLLSDDIIPSSPEEWAVISNEAIDILGNMSPRKSDLQEFWRLISQRSRSISVDSLDLSVYIFQESRFRAWVNPFTYGNDANVYAMSASERYAASLLLFNDDIHFKRKPTILNINNPIEPKDSTSSIYNIEEMIDSVAKKNKHGKKIINELLANGVSSYSNNKKQKNCFENEEDAIDVIEGGFKVLDEGLVQFKECDIFVSYYNNQILSSQQNQEKSNENNNFQLTKPFRAGCITKQLRALELYALSPSSLSPPKSLKALLKRLSKEISPVGARAILSDLGHNSKSFLPKMLSQRNKLVNRIRQSKSKNSTNDSDNNNNMDMNGSVSPVNNNITPWSSSVIEEAMKLKEEVEQRREEINNILPGKIGKIGMSGLLTSRRDYRANNDIHPVIAIDSKYATFFDDAFSLSPETGEILIHVSDVMNILRKYPLLQQSSKERLVSTFLHSGPLHMLPPQALDSLKLSSSGPNEVITIGLSVDSETGNILGYRVFPAVISAVFPIDIETANEILDGVNVQESKIIGQEKSSRIGFSNEIIRDLRTTYRLIEKILNKQSWIDDHIQSKTSTMQLKYSQKSGEYVTNNIQAKGANQIVNTLLTLYSKSAYEYCNEKNINVPIVWDNRDKNDNSRIRRFATAPLRNWLSQLQQKQLRSALKLELPLNRNECALAVSYHNSKRSQTSSLIGQGRKQMSFEYFESYCDSLNKSNQQIIFTAKGLGKGGLVIIDNFNLQGIVSNTKGIIEKGMNVKVKVNKIIPETKTISLILIDNNDEK
eukprot:gene5011-6998_t